MKRSALISLLLALSTPACLAPTPDACGEPERAFHSSLDCYEIDSVCCDHTDAAAGICDAVGDGYFPHPYACDHDPSGSPLAWTDYRKCIAADVTLPCGTGSSMMVMCCQSAEP